MLPRRARSRLRLGAGPGSHRRLVHEAHGLIGSAVRQALHAKNLQLFFNNLEGVPSSSPDPTQKSPARTCPGVYVAIIVAVITIAAVVMSVLVDRGILSFPGTTTAHAAGAPAAGSSSAPATDSDSSKKTARRASHASTSATDAASAPQASDASVAKSSRPRAPKPVTGHDVAWIGDSVSAGGTTPVLKKKLPGLVVDAQIGRSSRVLASEIQGLESQGLLGNVLVVELGANGVALDSDIDAALDALGPNRQLILVTPHGGADNARTTKVYMDAAERLPQQIQIADWNAESSRVKDFAPDGIHIGGQGAGVLVDTVAPKIAEAKARLK